MNASRWSAILGSLVVGAALVTTGDAHATGPVCDIGGGPAACINAITTSGGVVNDIFKDAKGRTATNLPVYGTLLPIASVFPSCTTPPAKSANCAGCNPGTDTMPADCPGQYTCVNESAANPCTVASVSAAVNGAPDHKWGHPCRISDHTLTNGCPNYTCVADGTGGGYNPWEGFVFDLGGPSNQVAIFATNDHGPQPCESVEYTVFLTNDPTSRDIILAPTTNGADPKKWNRAVLKKVYTWGWYNTRAPDPTNKGATCGDTATYAVEQDSMVPIYALPCGINFRYAAIVAGNDGRDFASCAFDSNEAELDAVAGLTETGDAVCPDKDGDSYVDCSCTGAPKICDCDDNDPNTHPNAPESCDAPKDYNCNGVTPEPCPPGKGCAAGICVPFCGGELGCPPGSACQTIGANALCVPTDCTVGGCPPGAVCDATTKKCVPACDAGVVCPPGEKCIAGQCVDPCRDVKCAASFTCKDGICQPPCSCFTGDVGCTGADKCDRPNDAGVGTDQCVSADCVGVSCPAGKYCKAGACVGFCDGVKCPPPSVCVPPGPATDAGVDGGAAAAYGCVDLCAGVSCAPPQKCDPATGTCVAPPPPDGGFVPPPPTDDAGTGSSGSSGGDSFGAGDGGGDTGGCSCTTAGLARFSGAAIGAIAALMLLTIARRRRG